MVLGGLVWLKMLIQFIFVVVDSRRETYWNTLHNGFQSLYHVGYYSVNDFIHKNYENKEEYPDLKKHADKLNKAYKKYTSWTRTIARFFEDHLRVFNDGRDYCLWSIYSVCSFLAAFCGVIWLGCSASEFKKQVVLYDNGSYSGYVQYLDGNYKNFPMWEKNAKIVIENAERLNDYYYTRNGELIIGHVQYILPENREKLRMIDTNAMYSDFLKICENPVEVIK